MVFLLAETNKVRGGRELARAARHHIPSSSHPTASSMTGARFHWASISSTRLSRYPGRSNTKSTEPASSSSTPSSDSQPSASSPIGPDAVIHAKPLGDSPADPRIQNRGAGNGGEGDAGGDGNDSSPSSQLPTSLDILWSPEPHAGGPSTSNLQNLDLPPPEIFEDVLDNLRVTLNPQTQHHATSTPQDGITSSTVEPTLALYCPIEGGYHVLDETVKELARGIEADVVVLDCAQLAAGSAGQFGSGASSFDNLHFVTQERRGADYVGPIQLQMCFNCPTIPFIFRFLHGRCLL